MRKNERAGCTQSRVLRRGIRAGILVLLAALLILDINNASAITIRENITNDGFTTQAYPNDINSGGDTIWYGQMSFFNPNGQQFIYLELPSNNTNTTLYLWCDSNWGCSRNIKIYSTTIFNYNTLSWNNQPSAISLLGSYSVSIPNGYNIFLINSPSKYIRIEPTPLTQDESAFYNSRSGFSLRIPYITYELTVTVTISCPIGWCYAASNYSSKTLLELDNLFAVDTVQGKYNVTSQKYESHRTGYAFNQNVSVSQKEGYYYYFTSAQDITTTPGSTPSITLKTGWNLVGNYGSSARTLSALKTSIGATATQAKYYDKTLKTWVSTDSQSVPAMEAFFVYITTQTDWSG